MFNVYKPSGGIGFLTWPLFALGLLIVVGLAFVYQFLLDVIPFIYVNALLTVGMGIAIGAISAFIIKLGHCRNFAMAMLMGVVLATAGLGAKYLWQFRSDLIEGRQWLESTAEISDEDRPLAIAVFEESYNLEAHLQERVDTGWSIGRGNNGAPIGGWLVYLVWLIEAGIVFYCAWTMAKSAVKEPYSEKMRMWADESEMVMTLPITDDEMVAKIQSATSVDELLEIPIPKTDQSAKLAQYIVNSIPGQEMEDAYLTVNTLEYSVNKKGEQETTEKTLVQNAVLSSQQRAQLVENAELLNEALQDYRASVEADRLAEKEGASASGESGDVQ